MFIETQSTPNPSSLMFYPGKPVMEVGSADFPNARSAMNSPLAKALYGVDGTYLNPYYLFRYLCVFIGFFPNLYFLPFNFSIFPMFNSTILLFITNSALVFHFFFFPFHGNIMISEYEFLQLSFNFLNSKTGFSEHVDI